ncbi:hypothetical protein NKH28_30590 [Mesorhizobium sp. M1227]|uniref:hypothetical protein n=1 Tax=Mesorhizobium sp. M1227 TaxID=2957071 RepID=UPI0033395152
MGCGNRRLTTRSTTAPFPLEKRLHDRRRIEVFGQRNGAAIDDQRPERMIGHQAIIADSKFIRFARPQEVGDLSPARPGDAGDLLNGFLRGLQNAHDAALDWWWLHAD